MCDPFFAPEMATGFHIISPKAERAEPRPEHYEARDVIWEFTKKIGTSADLLVS